MSEEIRWCVRGCMRRDNHLKSCEDRDECRGCEPRRAEYGNLCWPCHRRLELMIYDLPAVVDWLRVHLHRGSAQRIRNELELIRAKNAEAPIPLDLDVLDHIDAMFACVIGWMDNLLDDVEAGGSKLKAPEVRDVKNAAQFLRRHLSALELRPWIGEAWEELAESSSIAHGLAPWRPELRRLDGIPCPDCHACALVIYGGDVDATCQRCRMIVPEKWYPFWTAVAAERWASDTHNGRGSAAGGRKAGNDQAVGTAGPA